ncbi:MAG: hypothetical protein CM1200mP10_15670 [Candidatus Neomarinimicrobiota bacterium]|nr:MAG: hypothetical protein CM1200mP10_15670 [Candidatus Neomarinimicrobiota bacterium]
MFSSAMKVNSQYMHVLWFNLKVNESTSLNEVKDKLSANKYVALTAKDMTSTVFSFWERSWTLWQDIESNCSC